MTTPMLFVRVVGEPYLSRCQKYYDDYQAAHEAYRAFSKKYGGVSYMFLSGYGITALKFPVKKGTYEYDMPETGWTKPDRNNEASRPMKKNVEVIAEMDALPRGPKTWGIFEGIPLDNVYTAEKGKVSAISSMIGYVREPYITWPQGGKQFFLKIPNIEHIKKMILLEYPDAVFSDEISNWKLPDSLVIVSEAEVDYEHAKAALEVEKAEKEKVDV